MFVQEVPAQDWIDAWTAAGYEAADTAGPTFRVRSALLWRRGGPVVASEELRLPTSGYHGSYVAGAMLRLAHLDDVPIAALSVHASPRVVEQRYLDVWAEAVGDLPDPRAGAGRDAGRLWDSDLVLATLRSIDLERFEVLAAGDLNECRAWDDTHPGEWGREFFERVESACLVDCLHSRWGVERRTSFASGDAEYQLDHVLATERIDRLITSADVDEWSATEVSSGDRSDHAPVRFTLAI